MYGYQWTDKNGIYQLVPDSNAIKEIRPVFKEELDYFGFDKHWDYPETDAPILWAEGIRRYVLNGELVADAAGGGYFTKPAVNIRKEGLTLSAIDIGELWHKNESLMHGLEDSAINFIRSVHDIYIAKGMKFVVAFSGGKDSLVLLDLASKALSPDEFVVIFSNTGMELKTTLEAVKRAKSNWGKLRFYEAESHLSPEETWDAFGPPGRRMRWCCSIHKSVPTLLKLREITNDYEAKAVVFEGVRAEESFARAKYETIREGKKNISQVNVSPILSWGTAEVYLYLLKNNILLNDAYREGFNRVGCSICPLSSTWRDHLSYSLHKDDVQPLLNLVEEYVKSVKPAENVEKYIEQGGWRARIGGRGLKNGGNRIVESIDMDEIIFRFSKTTGDWQEAAKILGEIVEKKGNAYTQIISNKTYTFTLSGDCVKYNPYSQMDRALVSKLRGVAYKVAYCVGCKACIVQCPTGAFEITDQGKIFIREEACTHCGNCINYTGGKGCLAAKSLSTSEGNNMQLKGMNRYQTFGFRREWLEHYFEYGADCFTSGHLGKNQYDALQIWLREAGLLTPPNRGDQSGMPTELSKRLMPLGTNNPITWSVIWTNLAYNSVITKWYMLNSQIGETYEMKDLVFMLGEDYSRSTRENAVRALFETFRHSPIGAVLKQGIPIPKGRSYMFIKQGWDIPEAAAILYSLYKFAEETGRYTFTLKLLNTTRGAEQAKGVDPSAIFGLSQDKFKNIVHDTALHYPEYIRVAFAQDLDNVMLITGKKSIDILDIAKDLRG